MLKVRNSGMLCESSQKRRRIGLCVSLAQQLAPTLKAGILKLSDTI